MDRPNHYSIPDKVTIVFNITACDPARAADYYHVLLDIAGEFEIRIGDKLLYREVQFPLVEFAAQASRWVEAVRKKTCEFSYDSEESEDKGLVWVRATESGWKIGSLYQEYEEPRSFQLEEILQAFRDYVAALRSELKERCAVDISGVLESA